MWFRKYRKEQDLTRNLPEPSFRPETIAEAKRALDLGLIDVSEYVEISLALEPIVDALSDPDLSVRRKAILDLAKHPNRAWAVGKLQELLRDGSEEVRLYAAETLDRLDSGYMKAIYRLETLLREREDEKAAHALAKLFCEYAEVGLPGETIGRWYLGRAEKILGKLLEQSPDSLADLLLRGKVRKLLGRYHDALGDYKRVLRLDPANREAFFALAEIYYLLGDYDSVVHSVKRLSQAPLPEELQETVEFWLDE